MRTRVVRCPPPRVWAPHDAASVDVSRDAAHDVSMATRASTHRRQDQRVLSVGRGADTKSLCTASHMYTTVKTRPKPVSKPRACVAQGRSARRTLRDARLKNTRQDPTTWSREAKRRTAVQNRHARRGSGREEQGGDRGAIGHGGGGASRRNFRKPFSPHTTLLPERRHPNL